MINWKRYKLNNACVKIGSGATPRSGDAYYKTQGISLIRSQNILDFTFSKDGLAFIDEQQAKELANVEICERDVLLNITGDSVARVCQVPRSVLPARVNQHVSILRTNKKILNPEFLKYSLISRQNKEMLLTLASTGATRKALTKSMLEQFEIYAPEEVKEQEQIALILSSLDNKIELNRRMNGTLEEIAATLFKKYFFDDIDPDNIPEGWRETIICKLIQVKDGTHDSPKQKESGFYLITSKHIKDTKIDFTQAYYISQDDFANINKRSKVDTYDILISMIGTVGVLHLVVEDKRNFAIKNIGLFKTSDDLRLVEYLCFYLKSPNIREYLLSRTSGSTQQYLTLETLRNIPVVLPSDNILSDFKKQTNPIIEQIRINDAEIETLSRISDTLLPKLMSGEIDLSTIHQNSLLHAEVLS